MLPASRPEEWVNSKLKKRGKTAVIPPIKVHASITNVSLTIGSNIAASSARRHAQSADSGVERAIRRLSTGIRVNGARDDAAGLAISERMTSGIRGAEQTQRNINSSLSLLQVADGVMGSISEKLQRLRELTVQAASPTNSANDKAALQAEADQLLQGITAEAGNARFNGEALFSDNTTSIGGDANKRLLLDRLKVGWLNEAESLIRNYYGIEGDGARLVIDVDTFTDGGSNVLAYVEGLMNGNGQWSNLHMRFDMADFSPANVSGSDRVVAHELAHAVMARAMNFSSLPLWFIEGSAELIHGADDRLAGAVAGGGAAAVVATVGGGFSYEGSYAAMRYLHDRLKDLGVAGGVKAVMQYLDNNQAANLDTALNAVTAGTYATAAAFVADFTANGVAFITTEMNLTNSDTGGIGGADADGGAVRTGTTVINDSTSYPSVLDGFAEEFPTLGGTTGTKQYVLQVGENVGDTFTVGLSAMNASALGLSGLNVSGVAAINIMHVDQALQFVDKQRANVGASMSRLESMATTQSIRGETLSASRSRIQDADYAQETAALTRTMILSQSATAMLAQANSTPQLVLALLR